jgi:hypothetical protein
MGYIVTTRDGAARGPRSFRRKSSIAALEKAIELVRRGAKGVRIADADGRQYEPARFIEAHVQQELRSGFLTACWEC